MSKYLASIMDIINHDLSVEKVRSSNDKIMELMEKVNKCWFICQITFMGCIPFLSVRYAAHFLCRYLLFRFLYSQKRSKISPFAMWLNSLRRILQKNSGILCFMENRTENISWISGRRTIRSCWKRESERNISPFRTCAPAAIRSSFFLTGHHMAKGEILERFWE